MVFMQSNPFNGFFRKNRLRKIAKQVRSGTVPKGVSREEIFEALRCTRPKGALEVFGILSARQFDKSQKLKEDFGVVGVRKVTLEFAELLADAMCSSGAAAILDDFNAHAQGQGSAAEASTDQALGDPEDGRNIGSQTHGASSNIYKSVATITATSAYTVIEHGIFNQTSTTGDYLLDRTKLGTEFTVATDDEVEWTYELTINTET
jgi:hypothetical protein